MTIDSYVKLSDMTRPAILIVGGAWHTADYLEPLVRVFEQAGYPTVSLGLPSVGEDLAVLDFSIDVETIRTRASQLIAERKEVIVVLHSLAGIPGTEALHGLEKLSAGEKGGVIAMVYIASQLPTPGNSFNTHLEALGNVTWKAAKQALCEVCVQLADPRPKASRH